MTSITAMPPVGLPSYVLTLHFLLVFRFENELYSHVLNPMWLALLAGYAEFATGYILFNYMVGLTIVQAGMDLADCHSASSDILHTQSWPSVPGTSSASIDCIWFSRILTA